MDKAERKFYVVKHLSNRIDIKLPKRATRGSAGYDVFAIEDVTIPPYHIGDDPFIIPTGIKVKMLPDEFIMLVNRSSNPKKKKLIIPNSMGIIDYDYFENEDNDGEMSFTFWNMSNEPVEIKKGEKLGQLIFLKYLKTIDDNTLEERHGGFGSTGV